LRAEADAAMKRRSSKSRFMARIVVSTLLRTSA